jgi:hypothetical protein
LVNELDLPWIRMQGQPRADVFLNAGQCRFSQYLHSSLLICVHLRFPFLLPEQCRRRCRGTIVSLGRIASRLGCGRPAALRVLRASALICVRFLSCLAAPQGWLSGRQPLAGWVVVSGIWFYSIIRQASSVVLEWKPVWGREEATPFGPLTPQQQR